MPTTELQEIEQAILDGSFESEDLSSRQQTFQDAVQNTKKKKQIHLSINNLILQKIKAKAYQQGLPYQTLINAILYKEVR